MIRHRLIIYSLTFSVATSCQPSQNSKKDLEQDTIIKQEQIPLIEKSEIYPVHLNEKINGTGIIVMKYIPDGRLANDTIKILNANNSVYAQWNYASEFFEIQGASSELNSVNENELHSIYDFKPRAFYTEYEIIHFEVASKGKDYYEVIINPEKQIKKRIKINDDHFTYYTWPEYIMTLYLTFDPKNNPLRTAPSESADTVYKFNDYYFKGIEIQGDWIKIQCNDDCKPCDKGDLTGWVKWRDGERLLLDTGIIC